ncbi:unnamed protein product [Candida verbasci]|uniref:Uncharacterized protein n=1 Tax=Candida verbasci TaxID=1227364 RepID=A0A9W4X9E8_9ASCO|nr:unnamed protein product [Candida verbasci]
MKYFILFITIFVKFTTSTTNFDYESWDTSYEEDERPSISTNLEIPSFIPSLRPPPPSVDLEIEIPSNCKSDNFKITSLEELEKISNCEILIGNLHISNFKYPIITLKLEKILGNLTIEKSPEIVRIEAPNLQIISNQFSLFELTSLSLISFPNLKWVNVLNWTILPILSNVNFNHEIEGIESITISDTSLTGFSGFLADSLRLLDINNNRFLDVIECNVEEIDYLRVGANSKNVRVLFPKLRKIYKLMGILNVESIYMDELEVVEGSISLIDNYFQQIRFPKISLIKGTLSLLKNDQLNHVEFPNLNEIEGGLMVINNTLIENINFFSNVNIIGGALELIGSIKEITFKQLKLVKGSAIVKSTSPYFDCQKWLKSDIMLIVRGGKLECTNAKNEKTTSRTKEDGSGLDEKNLSGRAKSGSTSLSSSRSTSSGNKLDVDSGHNNHQHLDDPITTTTSDSNGLTLDLKFEIYNVILLILNLLFD